MLTKNNISILKTYGSAIKAFKKHHIILAPFLLFTCLELAALIVLFLIPRMPLRTLLGPYIRAIWGERFLHYPLNFLLLPKLLYFARIALALFIGSFTCAIAVKLIADIQHKKEARLADAANFVFKKYFLLFTVAFVFAIFYFMLSKYTTLALAKYLLAANKKLLFLGPEFWMSPLLLSLSFLLSVFIRGAFIFAIPAIIINKEWPLRAITRSFILFKKLFIPTFLLIALPALIYIPVLVLIRNGVFLVDTTFPEIMLLVLTGGIIINSLIIDPLVTVAATILYIERKNDL